MIGNSTLAGGKGVMVAAEGNERNGVFGSPAFADFARGIFTLKGDDPGIDRGRFRSGKPLTWAG